MQVINMQRAPAVGVLLALLAALAAVSSTSASGAAAGTVIRMQLSHVDAGLSLTPGERLQRMALRSRTRAARLLSVSGSSASAPVTPGYPDIGEYLVHLGIGTPSSSSQPVKLVLDTGSDLIWTQCLPCSSCFPQDLPYFDPSLSSTLVNLTCDSTACQGLRPLSSCSNEQTCVYNHYSYGDNSTTSGELVADTFVFEGAQGQSTAVPNLSFGCGLNNSGVFKPNETGIAGFGRGNLSLPSQLKVDNFSYCFTNNSGSSSTPSPVLLGLPANLYGSGGAAVQTTPLIRPGSFGSSTYYYLNLTSITVGSTTLQVPASAFALKDDGTGGSIIDSGTTFTALPPPVFSLLRDAFASQMNMTPVAVTSLPGFLCFPASQTTMTVPTLQLQFDGATLDLPEDNYVFTYQEDENGPSNVCIAMKSTPDGLNLTIIGNYQQQNMHVLYDLAGNKLSFVPAQCDMV